MNLEEYEDLVSRMEKEEKETMLTKGKEYTQGDRLDNFYRIGKELDVPPETVLWVYLKKHLDSIVSFIREGKVYSEPIEGRIKDARVYLTLLRGLIEERRDKVEIQK